MISVDFNFILFSYLNLLTSSWHKHKMSWYKRVEFEDIHVYTQMGMIKVCDKLLVKPNRILKDKKYYFDDGGSDLYWLHDMMLEDGELIYEVLETSMIHQKTYSVFDEDLRLYMWPVFSIQRGIKKAIHKNRMRMKLSALVILKNILPLDLILKCVDYI